MVVGFGIAFLVAVTSPILGSLIVVPPVMLLAAATGIPFGLALPLLMGEFQGNQRFLTFSVLAVGQAGLKLVASIVLGVMFGPFGIIAGISLATAAAYATAYFLLRRKLALKSTLPWWRPAAGYLAVVLPSTISISVLLSSDVLLVKHFFSSETAGEYAAVAALGRAIFWGAGGIAIVLFPKVIFRRTQGVSGFILVNASLLLVGLGGMFGLGLLAFGPAQLLEAFAGASYANGANYLLLYGVAMTLLGGVAVLNAAHQSRGKPTFLAILIPLTILEPFLIGIFHSTLTQVVVVVDVLMAITLAALAILYVLQERVRDRATNTGLHSSGAVAGQLATPTEHIGVVRASLVNRSTESRPLRILILNWRCPHHPRAGGAERLTHEVARRLAAQGHSVEWFSASFPGAASQEELDGFRIVRAGNRWSVYWQAYRRYRNATHEHVDVVIDEVNVVPFFTPLWTKQPTFMLIHQLAREIWWYEVMLPLNLIGFLTEPFYLRLYRHIPVLTVSSSTAADLRRLGFKASITVIPEGVETIANVPASKSTEPSFLYVGRLVPSKRIEHIFMALARFRSETGAGSLSLIGSGALRYEQSLVRLARRLGLEDHVTFCGRLSSSEKHRLMAAAHALLMTSVREGWGLVVTEANACGTPAIVYDVPGLRDSVVHGSTGLVVSPHPHHLADAMIRVTSDPELYSRLVNGGEQWSANFTFDETTRAVSSALDELTAT
jgi:glycosyltransferase involved in cell wall biosynthesis